MKAVTLTAILFLSVYILIMPSASALKCKYYEGDEKELCYTINDLDISNKEKDELMQDSLNKRDYTPSSQTISLSLNGYEENAITINDIYESKITKIWKIFLMVFINYSIYSVLTKSSILLKWVNAD